MSDRDDEEKPSAATSRLQIARLLLAPVLALAAVGMHFVLNVPDEPVIENPRDQGTKAGAAKRRAEAAKKRRAKRRHQPRPGPEIDALLERFEETDFDKEPIVGKWARETQTMLNKAVVMSRKAAFDGAPEEPRVSVVRTQCRTVRCRILLRSPYEHEVRMLATTLERIGTLTGESIWTLFEVEAAEPPAKPRGKGKGGKGKGGKGKGGKGKGGEAEDTKGEPEAPDNDHYLQITVSLTADGIEGDELTLPERPKK